MGRPAHIFDEVAKLAPLTGKKQLFQGGKKVRIDPTFYVRHRHMYNWYIFEEKKLARIGLSYPQHWRNESSLWGCHHQLDNHHR